MKQLTIQRITTAPPSGRDACFQIELIDEAGSRYFAQVATKPNFEESVKKTIRRLRPMRRA